MRISIPRKLILALMVTALAACASGPSSSLPKGGERDDSERPAPNGPSLDY